MSLFAAFITIIQSLSISLGVGASTLAITNFFVAIADGVIDDTERRMMGVVYFVLRVAMALILVTTALLISKEYSLFGLTGLSDFSWAQILTLFVLYFNALLMSAHLVSTTFGPAIQAGSWYTLGALSALQVLGFTSFTFVQFFTGYITWMILAIGIVNAIMAVLRVKWENREASK